MGNDVSLNYLKIKRLVFYLAIGCLAFSIRLYLNFSHELIPGVNGGYYPLQVRTLLLNSSLGFSDMPFLFYLNAFIIKIISFFGFTITDSLIITIVKIVDSISIPLLLFPLYKIIRLLFSNAPILFEVSIISYAVLSFSPIVLTSDLQKNALAISFLFGTLAYLIAYFNNNRIINLVLSIILLIIISLTHFGTLVFALGFLFFAIGFKYSKRALFPLLIVIFGVLFLEFLFDRDRIERLINIGNFIFEKPALTNGMLAPPDYLIILISIVLAITGFIFLKKNWANLLPYSKGFLFAASLSLLAMSFPFIDIEYFNRISLFLFIPQIIVSLIIAPMLSYNWINKLSILLYLIIFLSLISVTGNPKPVALSDSAYKDLKNINIDIINNKETIIIARHGLEWWCAWVFRTKVGQDKSIDNEFLKKYKKVIIFNQVGGFGNELRQTPFHEPSVFEQSSIIHSSEYFIVYKSEFNNIE